jgi:hypothetical protein
VIVSGSDRAKTEVQLITPRTMLGPTKSMRPKAAPWSVSIPGWWAGRSALSTISIFRRLGVGGHDFHTGVPCHPVHHNHVEAALWIRRQEY